VEIDGGCTTKTDCNDESFNVELASGIQHSAVDQGRSCRQSTTITARVHGGQWGGVAAPGQQRD
jgi:hypothetical protein